MILFSIPDIRLFWSQDPRFSSQFSKARGITTFKPYSKYPECYKDVSFWLPKAEGESEAIGWHENDFCDAVRDLAGDFVESVTKVRSGTNSKRIPELTSPFCSSSTSSPTPRRVVARSRTASIIALWTGELDQLACFSLFVS
jgi:hypothetical protein